MRKKRLGVSKSHLCDLEKGRKTVSPERAARWAQILGYPESVLAQSQSPYKRSDAQVR